MLKGPVGWVLFLSLGGWGIWHFHSPEFLSAFDLVPGGLGDPQMVVAILEHLHRGLRAAGDLRDLPFYFPAKGTWGYSDGYLSHLFFYEPLRILGMGPFGAYQVCVLAFNLLDYLACYLLLRRGFDLERIPCALGAFLFAFNAVKFNQIAHTQLQCSFWLPLAVLFLVRGFKGYRAMGPWRIAAHLGATGLAFHLQLLTAYYTAWFFLLWTFLFMGIGLCFPVFREGVLGHWAHHRLSILGGIALFILGFLPFLWLYLPVRLELGGKDLAEIASLIPPPVALLWMGPRHSFWGWLWEACPSIQALPVEGEMRMGLGIAVLIGWVFLNYWVLQGRFGGKGRKKHRRESAWVLPAVLATDLLILASLRWGPWMPWKAVLALVPGAEGIRAVSRCVLAMALPLSILFSLALQGWMGKIVPGRRWILAILCLWAGGMVLEQSSLPSYQAFSRSAQEGRLNALAGTLPPDAGAFFVRPAQGLPLVPAYSATQLQIDAMLLSAWTGIPTLNGYSGHTPKGWGLYKVRSPRYPDYVGDWVSQRGVQGKIVGIVVDR